MWLSPRICALVWLAAWPLQLGCGGSPESYDSPGTAGTYNLGASGSSANPAPTSGSTTATWGKTTTLAAGANAGGSVSMTPTGANVGGSTLVTLVGTNAGGFDSTTAGGASDGGPGTTPSFGGSTPVGQTGAAGTTPITSDPNGRELWSNPDRSTAADSDSDGVSDAFDLCPATQGVMVGPDGCSVLEDGDQDGVPASRDLCPGSPPNGDVDSAGCSAMQRENLGGGLFASTQPVLGGETSPAVLAPDSATLAGDLLTQPPASGSVTPSGMMAFVLDEDGPFPYVFYSARGNVSEDETGYQIVGSLILTTPLGFVALANADVQLSYAEDRSKGLMFIQGSVELPFPALGALDGWEVASPARVTLGFAPGANLAALNLPLNTQRNYLYFDCSKGLSASNGPLSVTAPGGEDLTVVLDAADPFFALRGSMAGLAAVKGIENVAIGMSAQGLVPFAPKVTWGLPEAATKSFQGQLYLAGEIPFAELPLVIDGETVIDFDPDGAGRPISSASGLQVGANGTLNFSTDFLEVFNFETELGQASAAIALTETTQRAYISGILDPDTSFLPSTLPMKHTASAKVAGLLSDDLASSYLDAEGAFTITGAGLTERIGLDFDDLVTNQAQLSIASDGFFLVGQLAGETRLPGGLRMGTGAQMDARFATDPADWSVTLSGAAALGSIDLLDTSVQIGASGVKIVGALSTGVSKVAMSGEITTSGARLSGSTGVRIAVDAARTVTEWIVDGAVCGYQVVTSVAVCGGEVVTDGAVCGYETVTSGAVCGYEKITSGAICGYELITSGAVCGYEVVTSGAVCGYEVVTSGAVCGYEVVTSGAICGYELITSGAMCGYEQVTSAAICGADTVTSGAICGYETVTSAVLCGVSYISDPFCGIKMCSSYGVPYPCGYQKCDVPNSCSRAKSCSVPRTCDDLTRPKTCADLTSPKTCPDVTQPKTCEDVTQPKTCEDVTQPKTCEDVTQPKTCDDLTQPKTCDDLTQPKTCEDVTKPKTCEDVKNPLGCEHQRVVPDFHWGALEGKIHLTLSTAAGLTGSVSGNYCTFEDQCQQLAGGRLRVGNPMQACIDIPPGLGEFCAPF